MLSTSIVAAAKACRRKADQNLPQFKQHHTPKNLPLSLKV